MNKLSTDIQNKIYEYVNLYQIEYAKVIHQINMLGVWRNHIMYNCDNKYSNIMLNKIFFLSCNNWIWLFNKTKRETYCNELNKMLN